MLFRLVFNFLFVLLAVATTQASSAANEALPVFVDNAASESVAQGGDKQKGLAEREKKLKSKPLATYKVFGEQLFQGNFSQDSFTGFNPNYVIGIGDRITLRMWGAFTLDQTLAVDAQGNIFLPSVGPVNVLGVRNQDLSRVVKGKIKRVYKSNVQSYVSLAAAQPVKVYVSGFVRSPGLYAGLSSDSILAFIDQAGGVDSVSGSYVSTQLLRDGDVVAEFNLYDFLLKGELEQVQLHDGDTVHVLPRQHEASVEGLVVNPYVFEFSEASISLESLLSIADIEPQATHIRVVRNSGPLRQVDYHKVENIASVDVYPGDKVVVVADKRPGTISVRVEGEHASENEYILPYGTTLGALLERVRYNPRSNQKAIQLFRKSVQKRQKQMLEQSLYSLQSSVLTAKSATLEESQLRDHEADLVLQWIEKAREVEPRGQVILGEYDDYKDITLEDGDTVNVPARSKLVMIHGEVLFPTAVVHDRGKRLAQYLNQAGGLTQSANKSVILLLHPDGSFDRVKMKRFLSKVKSKVKPGDEVLVLPKVSLKKLQITKDISQVIYQVAIAAAVVVAL